MAAGLCRLFTHDSFTSFLLFDMIVGQGHAAVLHHLLLAADVYPDGTAAVVLEEQLVEGAVGEDEVVEQAAFGDVADVQIGGLAEEVLRPSHAVDGLVEGLAAVARVDDDGASDVVAQRLQDVAAEVEQGYDMLPLRCVVDTETLGRGTVDKLSEGEVLGELHAQVDFSFHCHCFFKDETYADVASPADGFPGAKVW